MDDFNFRKMVKASCVSISAKSALDAAPGLADSMDSESVAPSHVLINLLSSTPSFKREAKRLKKVGFTVEALEHHVRALSAQMSTARSHEAVERMFGLAAELATHLVSIPGRGERFMFLINDLACACVASGDMAIEALIDELGTSVHELLVELGAPQSITLRLFPADDVEDFEKSFVLS